MDFETIHENAWCASKLLKAMSNQHRLLILCQLVPGEKCVGGLERIIGLSQSALSQHLARLRRDGLVQTRRSAQTIYYSLAGKEAITVIMRSAKRLPVALWVPKLLLRHSTP